MEKLKEEKIKQEKMRQEKLKQEKLRQEKLREERLKQEKLKEFKLKEERLKQEKIMKENERHNRSESIKQRFKAHTGRYTYKKNIDEDINKYRKNGNYNKEDENISKREIVHKNSKTKTVHTSKYTKMPVQNNISSLSYNRNYSYQNIKNSNSTKNSNNKIIEFKYLNNNKKNSTDKNNTSYTIKTTKTTTIASNIINDKNKINTYKRRNDRNQLENNKYISNKSNYSTQNPKPYLNTSTNSTTNKIISLLKVQKNTSNLNYPIINKTVESNNNKKYSTEKYKKEIIKTENIGDDPIENRVKKDVSKYDKYLVSVKSAKKVYPENRKNMYEKMNEYNNREEELYKRRKREEENNVYEVPEKKYEEIISTVTMKKKNLGDNYKFHESKNLHHPNLTSFTRHRRINQRTIYGNEAHETREVKTYKIRPQYNEYEENSKHKIETNKMPYTQRDYNLREEYYDQGNYVDDGEDQGLRGEDYGDYENEVEEKYIEEEEAYYH